MFIAIGPFSQWGVLNSQFFSFNELSQFHSNVSEIASEFKHHPLLMIACYHYGYNEFITFLLK
jgi:pterin-4a-carbinolamine dehydratase